MYSAEKPHEGRPVISHDAKVMTLIGAGHFFSHFYILILPPLFPLLTTVYGVGYVELGLAVGLQNGVTALTQAPVGVLVDRLGARTILLAGLALYALSTALIGIVPYYPALMTAMALGGLGNAVFHPADYAILSSAIDNRRMGRAFSIHTFAGFAGFAAAPPVIVALSAILGWRWALIASGAAGLLIAFLMLINSKVLTRSGGSGRTAAPGAMDLGLLKSPPIMLALLMFVMLALSHTGLSNYSVAAFDALYGMSLAAANLPLTAYFVASAVGVLAGGVVADRIKNQDLVASIYMVLTALAIWPVAVFSLPLWQIVLLISVAGFFSGAIAPSRDLMVRAITPPGAAGRVFGFVTTGFNIGGIMAPLIFGVAMDQGAPRSVFWLVIAFSILTMVTILASNRRRA